MTNGTTNDCIGFDILDDYSICTCQTDTHFETVLTLSEYVHNIVAVTIVLDNFVVVTKTDIHVFLPNGNPV